MVKYFSVDWLAQSHHSGPETAEVRAAATGRPHVPCMVQPAPPTFGKSSLELKRSKTTEHKEVGENQGSCPSSPDSKNGYYSSGEDSKLESPLQCENVERDAQRRVRTKFSTEQLAKLEKIFNKHKYLDVVRRVKTAQKLDLTETQVRTWFQNRRMKMKREMQDNGVTPIPPDTFQRLVPLQFGGMAGQPARYPAFDRGAFYYPLHPLAPQPQMPPHFMAPHPHYYGRPAA